MINRIEFKDYKCFDNGVLENFKKINIIFGKNNIGKSSLLDILEMVYGERTLGKTQLILQKELIEEEIKGAFREDTRGGKIPGNHFVYGRQFIGENFKFELIQNGSSKKNVFNEKLYEGDSFFDGANINLIEWNILAEHCLEEWSKSIKRIYAERDVTPESESDDMKIDGHGSGVTTVINNFINKSKYDEELVRKKMLSQLNLIMGEDANFSEIITQQIKVNGETKWEIFLREEGKDKFPLSESGSGLKTIIMVLVYTILIPSIDKKNVDQYLFLFEELENNLHPALQRRLLKYLKSIEVESFMTTHSNVFLDNFNDGEINLIHVYKENENVKVRNINNLIVKNTILQDLGVKASDMLQSNGVIWVEGPSDRIYINKWIELWSDGKYKEGIDYQCLTYGGKLLSHLTFTEEELINVLKVNRNSIIVIDSDKKGATGKINNTKGRIRRESKEVGTYCWITEGREIENYISADILRNYYSKANINFEKFDEIEVSVNNATKKKMESKVELAKKLVEGKTKEDFKDRLDLDKHMTEIVNLIEAWAE